MSSQYAVAIQYAVTTGLGTTLIHNQRLYFTPVAADVPVGTPLDEIEVTHHLGVGAGLLTNLQDAFAEYVKLWSNLAHEKSELVSASAVKFDEDSANAVYVAPVNLGNTSVYPAIVGQKTGVAGYASIQDTIVFFDTRGRTSKAVLLELTPQTDYVGGIAGVNNTELVALAQALTLTLPFTGRAGAGFTGVKTIANTQNEAVYRKRNR